MWIKTNICTDCGDCERVCPNDAISRVGDGYRIGSECRKCGTCVGSCPVGAIVDFSSGAPFGPEDMGNDPRDFMRGVIDSIGLPFGVASGMKPDIPDFEMIDSLDKWDGFVREHQKDSSWGITIIFPF